MWSFGILLWEIFSYGRVPYPKTVILRILADMFFLLIDCLIHFICSTYTIEKPVNEVLSQIEQGYQMEKPDGCPDEIYALMKDTWHFDRTLRPTFSNTLNKLYKIKAKIFET